MAALLAALAQITGFPILGNTSFNTHGKPILNSAEHALAVMRREPSLTAVVIEGWLFESRHDPSLKG